PLHEPTEAQRVTDINIARFETVAQHAVHQKFVLVGVDAPVSVRILLIEIRLRALWNERLGDLLEATAKQTSTLIEAGFQEIDCLQLTGVPVLTGERQVPKQRPQVRLEHGCEVGYDLPFESGDIDGVGADEVRCAPDFVAFQDGKCPPLDLAERDRISN